MIKKPIKTDEMIVDAVSKSLSILECFSDDKCEFTLKDLSEITGMYKSRIMRLCSTLIHHGFLLRNHDGQYSLGPRLMSLGKIYERNNQLLSFVRPVLRELCAQTGESNELFILDGIERICIAKEDSPSPLRYTIEEGQKLQLYAGAGGKAILAYSSKDLVDRVLNNSLMIKLTQNTIVERESLEIEFNKIRNQGFASSYGEAIDGVDSIAAPVFDHDNMVCASLATSGPSHRFQKEREMTIIQYVLLASKKLSKLLGSTIY